MATVEGPRWRSLLALVVVLVFAGAGMAQMNQLLEGMRVSGAPADTLTDLGPAFARADAERTTGVLNRWKEYAAAVEQPGAALPTADAHLAGRWFVLLDALLFAPTYALVLALFFWRARVQIPVWRKRQSEAEAADAMRLAQTARPVGDGESAHPSAPAPAEPEVSAVQAARALALVSWAGIILIVGAFVFDELENYLYWSILDRGWGEPTMVDGWRLWLLAVASSLKWVFAGLAVLVALVLAWLWAAARVGAAPLFGETAAKARLRLVIAHILLVLLFGLALSGHEQLTDLIRRWTVVQLVLSVLLALLFALVVWLSTRRLLAAGQWSPPEPKQKWVTAGIAIGIIALAIVQLVLFVFLRGYRYHPGWGLTVPAAIVVLLAFLSWVLPGPTRPATVAASEPKEPAEETIPGGSALALPRALASAALILFAFGVFQAAFGYAVYSREWHPRALIPLGVALAAALASRLTARPQSLLWGAGAAALATLGLATVDEQDANASLVTVCSLLVALGGWLLYDTLAKAREPKRELRFRGPTVVGLLATLLLLGAGIVLWPIPVGQRFGVVGVLAFFLTALAVVVAMLVWLNGAIRPPLALGELGLVRFPLLSFFAVWFVAASLIDPGGYHDLRIEASKQVAAAPTLRRAFDCWLVRNKLPALGEAGGCPGAQTDRKAAALPLILVASTGGGVRAAYWTAVALDCAFERDLQDASDRFHPCLEDARTNQFRRSDSLFALSGISGGSVGLAAYAAHLSEKDTSQAGGAWVNERLSADALSPVGAWWLFLEFPRSFLQFHVPTDRSEILERAWEDQWPENSFARGLFELWREEPHVPLLLLNATSVADACRFNVSVLDANVAATEGGQPNCRAGSPFDEHQDTDLLPIPGEQDLLDDKSALAATRDLSDFLCDDRADVPLSAAAFLSSRFPFVNPSGRIQRRCPDDDERAPLAYVVDGGYLDTSAGSTVVELTDRLEPLIEQWNSQHAAQGGCLVPFLIQIDNGFEDEGRARPGRRPGELTLPLTTVFEARIGRAAQGRSAAALTFNRAFPASLDQTPLVDRYAHFVNQAHPGPRAPLGWVQSRASETELRDQILQKKNRQALHEVRRWLSGSLHCTGNPSEEGG